jgi:hypothetical protein
MKRALVALPVLLLACGDEEPGAPADAASDVAALDAATDTATDATDASDAAVPRTPPFDWVGVIGTGQSLSIGATAGNISTTQPFANLKLVDEGPNPKYPITDDAGAPIWKTVPLIEPIRTSSAGTGPGYSDGQYPNDIAGETPHSGMANTLSATWKTRGDVGDYVTAHTVVGWSGHCLVDIDKAGGKRAYPASLHETSLWKGFAAAAGKTYGVGGILLTHGECDAGNTSYGAGLLQLWKDYDADLRAITAQKSSPVLFVSQQSTIASGPNGSAQQVWRAGVDHPGQIVCIGPKYAYQYSSDLLHLPAAGYQRLGEKHAEVFDLVVNQKLPWKPLGPKSVTRTGATITVAFDVPNPPLVWDAHMAPPHQSGTYAMWAKGRGFEVVAGNTNLAIANVTIAGSDVVITLANDPGSQKVTVRYALSQDGTGFQGGTALGMRGLLRDSDAFVGYDAETVDVTVTQGSAVVTTTGNAFARRTGWDIVTGNGIAADTIVLRQDTANQVTLSAPYTGPTGAAKLTFRHDTYNWAVHFAIPEP